MKDASPGGFPGGPVVKNPPANAGDTGSNPDLGRCLEAAKPMCAMTIEEPVP